MVMVKVKKEEQNKKIMRKRSLKGKKERILKDWTWKKRKIKRRLEEVARKKKRKGNKVRLGCERIRINGH